jgi:transcription initiation factor IIE alpha subunit
MAVYYLCDSCGHRGVDLSAGTADEVQCEMCGEPVLDDPDASRTVKRRQGARGGEALGGSFQHDG